MGEPPGGDVVLLYYGWTGGQGKAMPKEYFNRAVVATDEQRFLSARKIGRRNEYTMLVSETEYQTAQTKNFLDKIYEGSAKGLVSNLILGDLLTDEEYEELKMLLEKGKENQ